MENNFGNVEIKESQAAQLEEIKELFLGGRMVFKGIKNNEVIFGCRGCDEEGKINEEGSEGHVCYEHIILDVKRILSENNFEDIELPREKWEEYVDEFKAKDSKAMQEYLKEKIKKVRPDGEIYFVNRNSIIVSGKEPGNYVILDVQFSPSALIFGSDPFELHICGEERTKKDNLDLLPALFLLRECKILTELGYDVKEPDEIPENVKEYLINTAKLFGDGEKGYQDFLNAGEFEKNFGLGELA